MSQVRQDGDLAVHVMDIFRIIPLDDDALDSDILYIAVGRYKAKQKKKKQDPSLHSFLPGSKPLAQISLSSSSSHRACDDGLVRDSKRPAPELRLERDGGRLKIPALELAHNSQALQDRVAQAFAWLDLSIIVGVGGISSQDLVMAD